MDQEGKVAMIYRLCMPQTFRDLGKCYLVDNYSSRGALDTLQFLYFHLQNQSELSS